MIPSTRFNWLTMVLLWMIMLPLANARAEGAILADHTYVAPFGQITEETFASIRDQYKIFYGHTSHGSQIISGLNLLKDQNSLLYSPPDFHEISDDLGGTGDISWVQPTRDWLNANPACNMVMWSWCGGVSYNTESGINTYLEAMNQLENDYPAVVFVYMTGHLDGGGPDGNLYQRNNQIRNYCAANEKVLFDFADIESWDPDGNYFPNENDSCNWCSDWCIDDDCLSCGSCAHSHCFNCYQKGKAFWTMMAMISGHPVSAVRNVPDLADVQIHNYPNPFNPQTEIHLRLEQSGYGSLSIFDVSGNLVSTLYSGYFPAGEQTLVWQGKDEHGRQQGSGIYFCHLEFDGIQKDIKMTLLK